MVNVLFCVFENYVNIKFHEILLSFLNFSYYSDMDWRTNGQQCRNLYTKFYKNCFIKVTNVSVLCQGNY